MHNIATLSTIDEFNTEIAGDRVVIIDFSADWCRPCQRIAPKFAELASIHKSTSFCKVDIDANKETAEYCQIKCVPTFQVWKNGNPMELMEGADEKELVALAENAEKSASIGKLEELENSASKPSAEPASGLVQNTTVQKSNRRTRHSKQKRERDDP